jgi:hypothetical protein
MKAEWRALSLPLKVGYVLAAVALVGLVWLASGFYIVTFS